MNKLKKIPFLFASVLFVSAAAAQNLQADKITLTMDKAVEYAVERNISLKQAGIQLDGAKRSKNFSWNSMAPSLSATASYSGSMPGTDAFFEADKNKIYLSGTAKIALTPAVYSSIRNAVLSYENQELTYEKAVRSIELNVRTAAYGLLYQQEQIKVQENSAEASRRRYQSIFAKYENGQVSRLDLLSAQIASQNADANLQSVKTSYQKNLASFKQILGIDQNIDVSIEGSFNQILDFDKVITLETLASFNTKSIAVDQAEKNVEIASNALLATRLGAYGPSISASYTYSYADTYVDMVGRVQKDGGEFTIGASIPLDGLMPWTSTAQGIASRKDTLKAAQLSLENERTTYAVNVQNYLMQIEQSRSNLKIRKSSIELAEETYQMAEQAYNRGTKDLLTLQSSADDLYSAKVQLISECYNLISSLLNLENTIGVPFGTLLK